MFHTLLLVFHTLIAAALVAVILVQRSEGGGLGTGSTPSGLMSARGAANFLTRATAILAAVFILTSIGLAALASMSRAPTTIDTSLVKSPVPVEGSQMPVVPGQGAVSGPVQVNPPAEGGTSTTPGTSKTESQSPVPLAE